MTNHTNNHRSPDGVEELTVRECKFCGELPTKYPCPQRGPYRRFQPEHFNVFCQCGACGPDAPTSDEAIAAWNTRPESESVTVMREALERIKLLGANYREFQTDHELWQEMERVAGEALARIGRS